MIVELAGCTMKAVILREQAEGYQLDSPVYIHLD
jgi:hypothetical protein